MIIPSHTPLVQHSQHIRQNLIGHLYWWNEESLRNQEKVSREGGERVKKQLEQFTWQTKWSYDNQMSVNIKLGTEWRPGANKVIP